MPDASNSPQSPPPQVSLPAEIEVPFHGQVRKVSLAEAPKLIGIALQDGHRREEIARMQAELKQRGEAQAAHVKVGEELARFAASNPTGARALDQVYLALARGQATPEQVLAILGGQAPSEGQPTTAAPISAQAVDPQTRAALAEMASKLNGVESMVQQRDAADAARARETQIGEALSRDEFLRIRPGAAKIVRGLLDRHLAAGMSIAEAVALETNNYRGALAEEATSERDRLQAQTQLATVQTSRGIPPITAPDFSKIPANADPQTRRSMRLAAIGERARSVIAGIARGAVSGPS